MMTSFTPQQIPSYFTSERRHMSESRHDATAERSIAAQRTRTTDVGMSLYCLRLHDGEEK